MSATLPALMAGRGAVGGSNNKIPRRCSRLGVSAEISTYRHKV